MPFPTLKNRPFWLITLTAAVSLVLSQLIQDGAFMDGMLYVSVSKNLADGIGTFWDPHYSKAFQSSFHEQPPLYFGLLALFYKALGSSLYVERFFCFCCFALTGFFIHKFWKKIAGADAEKAAISWFPVLLWIIIPICFWAYTNMVEEVVMSLFVLIAVYYAFRALFLHERTILFLVISGVFTFLAFLTKGPQGTFPLIAAGAFWLVDRKSGFIKALLYSLLLAGVPLLIYVVLIKTNPAAAASFDNYFGKRVAGTFTNVNSTTGDRFFLLEMLVSQLLPVIGVAVLLWLLLRKRVEEKLASRDKHIIAWLLIIGFAGVLPLMVTLEQRTFYLVTALPYFAIAIALWSAPYMVAFTKPLDINKKAFRIFQVIAGALLFVSLVFTATQAGKAKRDKEVLEDVYTLGKIIPRGEMVGLPQPMCYDFNFKEYLVRYFYINPDDHEHTNFLYKYFIIRKDLSKELVPTGFKLYPLGTRQFDLYVKS